MHRPKTPKKDAKIQGLAILPQNLWIFENLGPLQFLCTLSKMESRILILRL